MVLDFLEGWLIWWSHGQVSSNEILTFRRDLSLPEKHLEINVLLSGSKGVFLQIVVLSRFHEGQTAVIAHARGSMVTDILWRTALCFWTALPTQRPRVWAHRSLNEKKIMKMLIKLKWIYLMGHNAWYIKKKSGSRGRCMQLFGNKDWSQHDETEGSTDQRLRLKQCSVLSQRGKNTANSLQKEVLVPD